MRYFLGIDTSNYTTSLSLVDENGVLENLKTLLLVKEGQTGLRQSDALFAHVQGFPALFAQLRACLQARFGDRPLSSVLCAIGYSARPRDAQGSYMPCFLAGQAIAHALGTVLNIDVYPFSHQAGHVMAALYSADCLSLWEKEFLAFHVSGGTTDLLHVKAGTVTQIGQSDDLHAGQAVDRVGALLGLPFPSGPALEALCAQEPFPKCRVCVRGTSCSLSGLENQAKKMYQEGVSAQKVAAYTLSFLATTLNQMTANALQQYPDLPVLYAGGVMSNARIAQVLKKREKTYFATPAYSCDNASGIALLCRRAFQIEKG